MPSWTCAGRFDAVARAITRRPPIAALAVQRFHPFMKTWKRAGMTRLREGQNLDLNATARRLPKRWEKAVTTDRPARSLTPNIDLELGLAPTADDSQTSPELTTRVLRNHLMV